MKLAKATVCHVLAMLNHNNIVFVVSSVECYTYQSSSYCSPLDILRHLVSRKEGE